MKLIPTPIHTEKAFEEAIESSLLQKGGYLKGNPDEVYMTTKLEGFKTKYLPFNLGYNRGAGNPPNPNGYKTSYLWEYVWEKDSWMDILSRFLHLQVDEYKFEGKIFKQESLLFPRYHQLDVVRKLEE